MALEVEALDLLGDLVCSQTIIGCEDRKMLGAVRHFVDVFIQILGWVEQIAHGLAVPQSPLQPVVARKILGLIAVGLRTGAEVRDVIHRPRPLVVGII